MSNLDIVDEAKKWDLDRKLSFLNKFGFVLGIVGITVSLIFQNNLLLVEGIVLTVASMVFQIFRPAYYDIEIYPLKVKLMCRECHGQGEVEDRCNVPHEDYYNSMSGIYNYSKCPNCKGKRHFDHSVMDPNCSICKGKGLLPGGTRGVTCSCVVAYWEKYPLTSNYCRCS